MGSLCSSEIFFFQGFRLEPCGGGLYRLDQARTSAPVALGSRALDLLALLVRRKGEVISKDEIMAAVWPGKIVEEANLNVQISKLRHILDQNRVHGSCIQTVPRYGYRFTAEVTLVDPVALPETVPVSEYVSNGVTKKTEEPNGAELGADQRKNLSSPSTNRRCRRRFWGGVMAAAIGILSVVTLLIIPFHWHPLPSRAARSMRPPHLSIVVLPFTNLGSDRDHRSFADGVVENLTTDLSRVEKIFVISPNTAFTYRGKPHDTRQVGRELGVRYVLQGSIEQSGSQIRINTQLSDTETAAILWADRFDNDNGDLFALQDDIARRIALALKPKLISADAARPAEPPDALDYILRARAVLIKPPTSENRAQAITLFERALTLDPQSVSAQSWLARTLPIRESDRMNSSVAGDIAHAEELVATALAASPHSGLAHYAKGTVLRARDRFEEAIPEYETALASDRNWPEAYAQLGQCKFYTGSLEEYIPLVKEAIRLSPQNPMNGVWFGRVGLLHLLQSRIGEAVLWLEKARNANPGFPYIHSRLAAAYGLKGETALAASELAEARRLSGDDQYSSVAQLKTQYLGVAKVAALYEQVYFAGLRIAGMPEK
jgi:TolB-like protein/DNA-binding winged helix-turn-helix (wHTH) protein